MKRDFLGLLVSGLIALFGYYLFRSHQISELFFGGTLVLGVAVGLALSDRLKEFNIWGARVVLNETKLIQKDVIDREERVRKIALLTADVVGFTAAIHTRAFDEPHLELNKRWMVKQIRELLELAESRGADANRGLRFIEAMAELDAANENGHSAETDTKLEALFDTIKRET